MFISAHDCYQPRCSLIHSGSAEIEPGTESALDRFVFFDKTTGNHLLRFNNFNGPTNFLQLKADLFSETMFAAADEWDASVVNDPKVQAEKAKLLVIRGKGFAIDGVEFG